MGRLFGIVLVIIAIFAGLLFLMPKSVEKPLAYSDIETQVNSGGAEVVDVRTVEEYNASHIAGAVNIPLSDIQNGNLDSFNTSVEYYVYCHSGNRSSQATEILKKAGMKVIDLGAISHVIAIGGKACDTKC